MTDRNWDGATTLSRSERRALSYERWLDHQAVLPDGRPAWQAAKLLHGMKAKIFLRRLKDGWSPERASSQPLFSQAGRPKFGRIRNLAEREVAKRVYAVHRKLGID